MSEFFEVHGHPSLNVAFARRALEAIASSKSSTGSRYDELASRLWINIFNCSIELRDFDGAYVAMVSNSDTDRREDCVRRFVGELCEAGQHERLCQFPFIGLHDEVERTLVFKARNCPVVADVDTDGSPDYAKILYGYHVYRGNYRKAAEVMYYRADRLEQECGAAAIDALGEQAKALLASLNSLLMVDPENAWFLAPGCTAGSRTERDGGPDSREVVWMDLGEPSNAHLPSAESGFDLRIEVIQPESIRKKYLLALQRLCLVQKTSSSGASDAVCAAVLHSATDRTSEAEILTLLLRYGLFQEALSLASVFGRGDEQVFECLAARCVVLGVYERAKAKFVACFRSILVCTQFV